MSKLLRSRRKQIRFAIPLNKNVDISFKEIFIMYSYQNHYIVKTTWKIIKITILLRLRRKLWCKIEDVKMLKWKGLIIFKM